MTDDEPIEPVPVTLASAGDDFVPVEDSEHTRVSIQRWPADGAIRVQLEFEDGALWVDLKAETWHELLADTQRAMLEALGT